MLYPLWVFDYIHQPTIQSFVVGQKDIELVGAITPLIQEHALQNMFSAEAEPWVPIPTEQKEDNRKIIMAKGGTEKNKGNKEKEWLTANKASKKVITTKNKNEESPSNS